MTFVGLAWEVERHLTPPIKPGGTSCEACIMHALLPAAHQGQIAHTMSTAHTLLSGKERHCNAISEGEERD